MKHILCTPLFGVSIETAGQCSYQNKIGGAEWPTLRGNNKRDGRMVAKGEFGNSATLSQSIDLSTTEAYVEISPNGKNSKVKFSEREIGKSDQLLSITTNGKLNLRRRQTENGAYLGSKW